MIPPTSARVAPLHGVFAPALHQSEMALLLACMRFYLHTATASEITSLLEPEIDWAVLIQLAIDNGVMPLLYQSLKAIGGNRVPQSAMVQLQTHNRMNGLHTFSQTKELLKILNQLQSSGIAAIAFKGPVLAASAYGNVTLRQFNDLDILVQQQNFWQAKAVLVAHGYQASTSDADERATFDRYLQISLSQSDPEATMLNQRFQPSLLHSNKERTVDLHWGIPPRRLWKSHHFDRLWQNLNTIDLMGQPTQTFSPETTLVIQCINVAKEPWKRSFKQICDAAQIIQAYPNLKWEAALKLSSELRSQKLFLIGLTVTRKVLDVPLPQFILEKRVKIQSIDEQVFDEQVFGEQIFQDDRTPSGVITTWWLEYTDQLKTLDQMWDGLFVTGHYLRIILQLVFNIALSPDERDRELLPLPNWLFFVYYLFRPIRLLITYASAHRSVEIQNKL